MRDQHARFGRRGRGKEMPPLLAFLLIGVAHMAAAGLPPNAGRPDTTGDVTVVIDVMAGDPVPLVAQGVSAGVPYLSTNLEKTPGYDQCVYTRTNTGMPHYSSFGDNDNLTTLCMWTVPEFVVEWSGHNPSNYTPMYFETSYTPPVDQRGLLVTKDYNVAYATLQSAMQWLPYFSVSNCEGCDELFGYIDVASVNPYVEACAQDANTQQADYPWYPVAITGPVNCSVIHKVDAVDAFFSPYAAGVIVFNITSNSSYYAEFDAIFYLDQDWDVDYGDANDLPQGYWFSLNHIMDELMFTVMYYTYQNLGPDEVMLGVELLSALSTFQRPASDAYYVRVRYMWYMFADYG